MKKIDLHVHSLYSSDSQNAVIKALGSKESYVEPEEIFETAMQRGMDYVTITDHDTIDGCEIIKNLYPDKVVMGVETTAFFPEDGCPVHILIYGLDRRQFEIIDRIRSNVYDLRSYLQTTKLAHSVAHATYRLSDSFSIEHFEKLLLLFDVFEVINGNRSQSENQKLLDIINSLTPDFLYAAADKYGLAPFGGEPWIKGHTGGTDDHSGIFVATTWSEFNINSAEEIVPAIRAKASEAGGSSRTNKGFAFEIFKVAMDNFADKGGNPDELVTQISYHVLKNSKISLKNRYKIHFLKKSKVRLYRLLANILTESDRHYDTVDDKMNTLYRHVVKLSDEITRDFIDGVFNSFSIGNLSNTLKTIPRTFASSLIYIPAVFALKYINKDLDFLDELHAHFIKPHEDSEDGKNKKKKKKILWFTDSITDMNGVAVTLQNIGRMAYRRGDDLQIVASLLDSEKNSPLLPPNIVNLEPLVTFKLPYYEELTIRVPSVLGMLEYLEPMRPDEVFISSPGIIGLYGLLYSKIYRIKCTAVYHTDFTTQAQNIISGNSPLIKIIERYTKWFHEAANRILVPTAEYIDILMRRGFDTRKMAIFHRGINTEMFRPVENASSVIRKRYGIKGDVMLLYAGRISQDKNIDFLLEAVSPLLKREDIKVSLALAGDGPYLQAVRSRHTGENGIYFLGQIENKELPLLYSGCDLLVFPSETDTFGMVVLEAQACGRPALVSHIGGPKNIIVDKETGYVLSTEDAGIWTEKLTELVELIANGDEEYLRLCENSRRHVIEEFDAYRILENYVSN